MFEVISYDYSFVYKNAVKVTNKYIEENENAYKEEIAKYFAHRLEYEWKYIKKNNLKKSTYIYTVFTMAISFGLANHKCPLIIHYDLELITNNQEIIP